MYNPSIITQCLRDLALSQRRAKLAELSLLLFHFYDYIAFTFVVNARICSGAIALMLSHDSGGSEGRR